MTIKELCEVFSKEIGSAFEASKDEIVEQLFCRSDHRNDRAASVCKNDT